MKSTSTIHPFATNLALARKYAGMSLSDLAEEIKVSKQTISKYENGELEPSMKRLYSLASALSIEVEDFFKESNEESLFMKQLEIMDVSFQSFQEVRFREGKNIPTDLLDRVKTSAMKEFVAFDTLVELSDFEIKFKNPIRDLEVKNKHDAHDAAIKVRKAWKLGNGPIAGVVSLLENQGIRVIEVHEQVEFEGLSARIENIPIIVINRGIDEVTRRRFTALHELGHLILGIDEDEITYDKVERICDAFAAAMLMPKELLFVELGEHRSKISKKELITLKEKYGISVRAVLVSAAYCRIISWDSYHKIKLVHEFDSDFGQYFGIEKPTRFHQTLLRALLEGKLTRKMASDLSGWSTTKVKEFEENYV